MKGLKIIPMVLSILALAYAGVLFVNANNEEVIVKFGNHESPRMAVGFVVLTSAFVGMVISGLLCSVELFALYLQNKRLKRKISITPKAATKTPEPTPTDIVPNRTSGRFT